MYSKRLLEDKKDFEVGTGLYLSNESLEEISLDLLQNSAMKTALTRFKKDLKLVKKVGSTWDIQNRYTNEIYIGSRTANMDKDRVSKNVINFDDLTTRLQTSSVLKYCEIIGETLSYFRAFKNEIIISTLEGNIHTVPSKLDEYNRILIKKENIRKLSLIQYGEYRIVDDFTCIYDLVPIKQYDEIRKIYTYSYEIHHICVVNRSSKNKAKDKFNNPIAPSLQMSTVLSDKFTEELMGCGVMCVRAHDFIHDGKPNIDYRAHSKDKLPFVYRSKENYDYVVSELGISTISYEDFLLKETNPKMPENFINSDWI